MDTLVFSVNETGVYYFGFNAYSNFNAAYRIYNLLGKEIIFTRSLERKTQIDTAFLKPGLYIMRIGIDGHLKTFPLIKR